jgi:hypothetical protein
LAPIPKAEGTTAANQLTPIKKNENLIPFSPATDDAKRRPVYKMVGSQSIYKMKNAKIKNFILPLILSSAPVISSLTLFAEITLPMNSGAFAAEKNAAVRPLQVEPKLEEGQITVKGLGMERSAIARPDSMQWIFNGRGKCFPRRWSVTGFNGCNISYGPWEYSFHFDFVEKRSGTRIVDNAYELMDAGQDPCGFNFRAGETVCIVPQDDTWYPHFERRTGTFCKNYKTGTVSFGIETRTIVSARANEVLMAMTIENRDVAPLTLALLPMQMGANTLEHREGGASDCVVTDLASVNGQSLGWTIPPKTKQTHNFAISYFGNGEQRPSVCQPDLGDRVKQADEDGEEQIRRIAGCLPSLQTPNQNLDQLYKRCIASLAFCRWDREEYRNHPTWACGGFMCVVSWDFSFSSDCLCLLDPAGVRHIIGDVLGIGQMRGSYIPLSGSDVGWILYIQDPFALRDLINSYIKMTGDRTILDDQVGGRTVYDWLKLWAAKLDTFAKRPDGLIDMGDGNEFLLELRTDGYDHVVPTVNGLAVEYFGWLAQLAKERNDPEAAKFAQRAEALNNSFQNLWDEKAGWFDNLYADGSRQPFFTMHLFDLLGTSVLTEHQKQRIASHFVEGDFLAPMGIYAISRKDTVHWDRFDQDWGGGGCYIGTPLRTARYLYENGDAPHAWEVLKRTARLAAHFSYMPQSPAVDEPFEWRSGGNLQISSGAGLEAICSGVFGLRPQPDGSLAVCPAPFNPEIGESKLSAFQFRHHRYDVDLKPKEWQVFVDGKLQSKKNYGQSVTIPSQKANISLPIK